MGNLIVVGISDQRIANPGHLLITYALGSCVAICLYDARRRVGGLAHILLPQAFGETGGRNIFKFADTAIQAMVISMSRKGCTQRNLSAKIAGGANMFASKERSIGDRNIEAVKSELQRLRIVLVAEDIGANYGRTAQFDPEDGSMTIKTANRGDRIF